jgi:hypothetical protein
VYSEYNFFNCDDFCWSCLYNWMSIQFNSTIFNLSECYWTNGECCRPVVDSKWCQRGDYLRIKRQDNGMDWSWYRFRSDLPPWTSMNSYKFLFSSTHKILYEDVKSIGVDRMSRKGLCNCYCFKIELNRS